MSRSKYKPVRLDNYPGWARRLYMDRPFRRRTRAVEKLIVREKEADAVLWPARPKLDWWS